MNKGERKAAVVAHLFIFYAGCMAGLDAYLRQWEAVGALIAAALWAGFCINQIRRSANWRKWGEDYQYRYEAAAAWNEGLAATLFGGPPGPEAEGTIPPEGSAGGS